MSKWTFIKPEPKEERGICVICEVNPQKKVSGKLTYRAICSPCDKKLYESKSYKTKRNKKREIKRKPYTSYKKTSCDCCGFIAIDSCQLDVDHIDGNHLNNLIENLQTLCANCHRLKTKLNKDYLTKKPQEI